MILTIIFFLKQLQVTSNQQSLIKYQSLTMSCELLFWYNYTVGVKNKLYCIYFTSNELYLTFPFEGKYKGFLHWPYLQIYPSKTS